MRAVYFLLLSLLFATTAVRGQNNTTTTTAPPTTTVAPTTLAPQADDDNRLALGLGLGLGLFGGLVCFITVLCYCLAGGSPVAYSTQLQDDFGEPRRRGPRRAQQQGNQRRYAFDDMRL